MINTTTAQSTNFQQLFINGNEIQRFNVSVSNREEELDIWTSDIFTFAAVIYDLRKCEIISINYFGHGNPTHVEKTTVMVDMCYVDDDLYQEIKASQLWHQERGRDIEISVYPLAH